MSMEICPDALEQGSLRLHFHVCLKSGSPLVLESLSDMMLFGIKPHASHGDGSRRRHRVTDLSAYYYVFAPKIGSMFAHSSQRAYKDFLVNAEWAWNMLQQEKMTVEAARREGCSFDAPKI